MARKPVIRNLPLLSGQFPSFKGFSRGENKTESLLDLLREVAKTARRRDAHPFYTMREVAAFFGVALPSVSTVYRQLEREGLLIRRRSSRTDLAPLKAPHRVIHRGIVVAPVWLAGFLVFYDWRCFFIELENRLRRHRMVTNLLFSSGVETLQPSFLDRVLSHEPEYLVWLGPDRQQQSMVEMLADTGLRMVILGKDPRLEFRGQRYRISWQRGLEQALESYASDGIRHLEIPWSDGSRHSSVTMLRESQLKQAGFSCSHPQPHGAELSDYVDGLGRQPHSAVLLDEDLWWSEICAQSPRAAASLLHRCRVLVVSAMNLSSSYLKDAHADSLQHDWIGLARRVADDISSGEAFSQQAPVTFEAEYRPHRSATELAPHFDITDPLALR